MHAMYFLTLLLILVFSCHTFVLEPLTYSLPLVRPSCSDEESSALLNFKQAFLVDCSLFPHDWVTPPYPKTNSWENGRDCCLWDGVKCDEETGHVIGLNLSESCLYGNFPSNSSLFSLIHLQILDLSFNNFTSSRIPSQLGQLTNLISLNATESGLSGQIPFGVSKLSNLSVLDLSWNNGLSLTGVGLEKLLQNFTRLTHLALHGVDISSPVPTILANFTSLKYLSLSACNLHGSFPSSIFGLPLLEEVHIYGNSALKGFLPEFQPNSRLREIDVESTAFYGQVPPSVGEIAHLEYLNLRNCSFSGSIPSSLGKLKNLTVLDLSDNHFSGGIPSSLGNLKKLTYLGLGENQFRGGIPSSLGNLKKLNVLYLSHNHFSGGIPSSLGNLKKLTYLGLGENQFSGGIPSSLGNLKKLTVLDLSDNHFSGGIPSSLGNLKKLTVLDLSYNHFSGRIPPSFANLTQLQDFSLTGMDLAEIPSFIANFTGLEYLSLRENQLIGQIPLWLMNLTQLQVLSLSNNHLKGPIPEEISQLINLQCLGLSTNDNLHGNFGSFLKLRLLTKLELSGVNLASPVKTATNESQPRFKNLFLDSCNLMGFPQFLQSQNKLEQLTLSNNTIQGLIPQWFVNITRESLCTLCMPHNFLTGFEHPEKMLPWNRLEIFDLSYNKLQGPLPIPPTSIKIFDVSNNQLEGNIPQQICLATSLNYFDVSSNALGGQIPHCISELAGSLAFLNLRGNNFNGTIPYSYPKSCKLRMISLGQNQLGGTLPRSLVNCSKLVALDVGENHVNDTFPSWLGCLRNLQFLVLRHNKFHGRVLGKSSKVSGHFQSLRIIDLSHNFYIGDLPSDYLQTWNAMKIVEARQSRASGIEPVATGVSSWIWLLSYSIFISNKGSDMLYPEIWTTFMVIDFSSNNFKGRIPDSIGELRGLHTLNLSNNNLEGGIPSSLSNIRALESLDLSTNKLSGGIPQELAQLTFLGVFNVSHNLLTGPIPQGTQFDTFDNSSFDGNPGLCGIQVSKTCGNVHKSPPSPPVVSGNEEEEEDSNVIDWIIRALGCVAGFIVGYVIGNLFTDRHHDWFVETFGKKRRPRKTRQGAPRRRT